MGNGRPTLKDSTILTYVKLIKIDDTEHLNKLITEAQSNGWEGNMIRKDVGYEGKRSNDLLKIKKFHDEFENRKITQKFSDHIDLIEWQYETLDEAKRISGILKERIIEGLNESR